MLFVEPFKIALSLLIALCGARDYYDVLGVRRDASESEIKQAYRQLSLKYHPDKNKSEDAAARFAEVASAYEILSDSEKRTTYDTYGEDGLKRREQGGGSGGGFDPFESFFSGFGFQSKRRDEVRRTANVMLPLRVSLKQLYEGDVIDATYARQVLCLRSKECETHCSECIGPGMAMKTQQLAPGFVQQMQMRDDRCIARGKCWNKKCKACPNGPTETESTVLTIELQRGMTDGETIVFEESADEAVGYKAGDLVLTITTTPHPDFTRKADDLFMTIDISLLEALVGFERAFTHLDGHMFTVSQTTVAYPGEVITMRNEGMPRRHSRGSDRFGSLSIRLNIVFPETLTAQQKAGVREILGSGDASLSR